jgi:putative addiction module component (TIGR02574 family)
VQQGESEGERVQAPRERSVGHGAATVRDLQSQVPRLKELALSAVLFIAMNADLLEAAKALPLPQRIELAEALCESITGEGHEPPLTPAQAEELDRRLQEHRRDSKSGIPWEQVKVELDQKYGRSK